jgi:hypothetical protein
VSRIRVALAFLVAPLVFAALYWAFLISFWTGVGGYLYSGAGALVIGYPIGFVLVLAGGLPLVFRRLPTWLELALFVSAGLLAAALWMIARNGRLVREDLQFLELCAVSSAGTYPAFVRLAGLGKAP